MIGKTMLFNPFTGQPRHPSDIQSDPSGILMWDGEEPLKAATKLPAERAHGPDNAPIAARLSGRISYLLNIGRVKDPELMQSALEALTDLADATRCLLDDMGSPDDGTEANLMNRCRAAIAKATGKAA